MAERKQTANDGEPLWTEERPVRNDSGEFFHNIPAQARKIIGLDETDELEIEIYQDGYVVQPVDK